MNFGVSRDPVNRDLDVRVGVEVSMIFWRNLSEQDCAFLSARLNILWIAPVSENKWIEFVPARELLLDSMHALVRGCPFLHHKPLP